MYAGGMHARDLKARTGVSNWLFVCTGLIAVMVVVGGLTRLTGSGLSITEWDLVMGTLPPLSETEWQRVFGLYQQSPEYLHVNTGMSMAEFKAIFWWEYVHRLIGRSVGLVFLLPFLYFLVKRMLTRGEALKLGLLFLLGAAQGVLGWYMVMSGLVDDPRVSHFRLTAHLMLAFFLFGATLWQGLQFRRTDTAETPLPGNGAAKRLFAGGLAVMLLILFQIALGAMVAGLKAGYMFNSFPKMAGFWVPPGMQHSPLMNPVTVQFTHRTVAYLVVVCIAALWWKSRAMPLTNAQRGAIRFLLLAVAIQFALGVFTLLYRVPVTLGALHQFGALILFGGVVYLAHTLRAGSANARAASAL